MFQALNMCQVLFQSLCIYTKSFNPHHNPKKWVLLLLLLFIIIIIIIIIIISPTLDKEMEAQTN